MRILRVASAPAYQGPGDIVSGAIFWVGLRAYSAAKAGTKCVRIINETTTGQQDFNTLTNGNLDIVSIATFLSGATGKIVTLYDQSGNSNDFTQTTDAKRPVYSTASLGGLPTALFSSANSTFLTNSGITLTNSPPLSYSFVTMKTTDSTTIQLSGGTPFSIQTVGSANKFRMFDGSNVLDASATDSSWHACQFINTGSGASASQAYIDGVQTFGTMSGASINVNSGFIGSSNGSSFFLDGNIAEIGLWPSDMSSVVSINNSKQHTYWGF